MFNKSIRNLSFAALVASSFVQVVSAQPRNVQEPRVTADGTTMRLQVYSGAIINLMQWVMVERGLCTAHKLNCELVPVPSAPLGIQALVAGSLDVVISSADVVIQAAAGGAPVTFIGGLLPTPPFALSMRPEVAGRARAAAYPANVRELKGMKIGVTARGAGPETQMRLLLADVGMNPETDVIFVAVGPPSAQIAALSAKQIDGVMSFEPVPTICENSPICFNLVDLRKGEGSSIGRSLSAVTYAASKAMVEKNPRAIDAFRQASAEAIEWAADPANFAQVMAVAKKYFTLGDLPNAEATTERLVKNQVATYSWKLNRDGIKNGFDYLATTKPPAPGVSVSSFIYPKAY